MTQDERVRDQYPRMQTPTDRYNTILNTVAQNPPTTVIMDSVSDRVVAMEHMMHAESIISGRKKFTEGGPKIYTQLTMEMKKDLMLDHLKHALTAKEVYELAATIFEDENLHIAGQNLYIRWPEIKMTNSSRHKHTIYDMIVKLNIGGGSGPAKLYINLTGMRGSCTTAEVAAGYSHSHLETFSFGRFGTFCVGSSDFNILIHNVQLEPSVANWLLLLMSLKNYLAWESIEGGPYIRMANIRNPSIPLPEVLIEQEALRLVGILPPECIDVSSMSLIDGAVFRDFIHQNSRVRKSVESAFSPTQELEHERTFLQRGRGIKWKGGELFFKMLRDGNTPDNSEVAVEEAVVARMIMIINKQLTDFDKTYQHEHNKKTKPRAHFTLGQTKADRIRNPPEANRLSPQPPGERGMVRRADHDRRRVTE